jgi:hypothetical protein
VNERILNYGTGAGAPRTKGESGWRCLWLSVTASALMALLFAGLVKGPAGQLAMLASIVCSVAAVVSGIRCFWRRERNRAAAMVGFVFLLPAIGGYLFLLAWLLGFIGFPS